jgi:hypothetical protein
LIATVAHHQMPFGWLVMLESNQLVLFLQNLT